jgi:hypothetical protein
MMMARSEVCGECCHFKRGYGVGNDYCNHIRSSQISLVDGKSIPPWWCPIDKTQSSVEGWC